MLVPSAWYFGREDATLATFGARTACGFRGQLSDGRWLRTGDLGVLIAPANGSGGAAEIVITGRLKDVIIIGGRNYHPQDIEAAAEAAGKAVLRPGCSAAVEVEEQVNGAGAGTRVVYVAECRSAKNSPGDLRLAAEQAAGAATRPLLSSTRAVFVTQCTRQKL